ncbi:MAG: CarD family transcriptional regulator [Candidatus Sumerlaeaceae bacterium]|jgi:RNA polymerase-interacting CarD/CdnL/TRCF family regulator
MEQFKTGDKVVEPTIGICEIQGIRRMSVDGKEMDFYVFAGPNNATVLVPKHQIEKRGVRLPMTKEETKKVIQSLKQPTSPDRETPHTQYTKYREILNTGDPSKISKLIRDLYILDQNNALKGKEREIMELAKKFLTDEICFVRNESRTKVAEEIEEALRQMFKKKAQKEREEKKKAAKKK